MEPLLQSTLNNNNIIYNTPIPNQLNNTNENNNYVPMNTRHNEYVSITAAAAVALEAGSSTSKAVKDNTDEKDKENVNSSDNSIKQKAKAKVKVQKDNARDQQLSSSGETNNNNNNNNSVEESDFVVMPVANAKEADFSLRVHLYTYVIFNCLFKFTDEIKKPAGSNERSDFSTQCHLIHATSQNIKPENVKQYLKGSALAKEVEKAKQKHKKIDFAKLFPLIGYEANAEKSPEKQFYEKAQKIGITKMGMQFLIYVIKKYESQRRWQNLCVTFANFCSVEGISKFFQALGKGILLPLSVREINFGHHMLSKDEAKRFMQIFEKRILTANPLSAVFASQNSELLQKMPSYAASLEQGLLKFE